MVSRMDKKLEKMIREEFPYYAEEILVRVACGETVDSAIQSVLEREEGRG